LFDVGTISVDDDFGSLVAIEYIHKLLPSWLIDMIGILLRTIIWHYDIELLDVDESLLGIDRIHEADVFLTVARKRRIGNFFYLFFHEIDVI
jgi:hypothetical protein